MKLISVNQAIDQAHDLNGECVAVEGLLTFAFENVSINHWPKAERKEGYASSLWIDNDGVVFSLDEQALTKWNAKRVVVFGIIETSQESHADGWENGFGHFGLWSVRIRARRIDLLNRWVQDHPGIKNAESPIEGNLH